MPTACAFLVIYMVDADIIKEMFNFYDVMIDAFSRPETRTRSRPAISPPGLVSPALSPKASPADNIIN